MPKRIIHYSRSQPSRTILAIIATLTLLAGLWLMTPFGITSLGAPALSVGFGLPRVIGAGINCLFCIPALRGVKHNTPEALANGGLWLFLWYIFVTLLRLFVAPIGSTIFVPTLIICLVLGVIYLEQSFRVRLAGKEGEDE